MISSILLKLAEVNISASFMVPPMETPWGLSLLAGFGCFYTDFFYGSVCSDAVFLILLQRVEYQQARLIHIMDHLTLDLSLQRIWDRIEALFSLVTGGEYL